MKRFLKNIAVTVSMAALAITSCDNFETKVEKSLSAKGMTKEQAEVAAAEALRGMFTRKVEKEDGTVTYEMNYSGITDEDILYTVERMHQDLSDALKPDGDILFQKYLKNTGMGDHLALQEKVFKYHTDMLRKKVLHQKFEKLVNGESAQGYFDPYSIPEDRRYSLATTFPLNQEEQEFDAGYVKTARNAGKLKDKSAVVEEITQQIMFLEKMPNPKYSFDKGESEWIYVPRKMGIRAISYNLDNDDEKEADYVEIYRIKEDGKTETKPAIKVFKPNGVGSLELILADQDNEGQPGYGIPDHVGNIKDVASGWDVFSLQNIIDLVFKRPDSTSRESDMTGINKLYVTRAGTIPMGEYELKPDGWESDVPDYKPGQLQRKGSFTVHLKTAKKASKESPPGDLEWIAVEYSGGSRVVEFYRPNSKFTGKNYTFTANGRKISVTKEDGRIEQYDLQAIVEDMPYRIDFDRNKQKRWEIRDKDNDKIHYEAKRERAATGKLIPTE